VNLTLGKPNANVPPEVMSDFASSFKDQDLTLSGLRNHYFIFDGKHYEILVARFPKILLFCPNEELRAMAAPYGSPLAHGLSGFGDAVVRFECPKANFVPERTKRVFGNNWVAYWQGGGLSE
jgi:hypothetical protein